MGKHSFSIVDIGMYWLTIVDVGNIAYHKNIQLMHETLSVRCFGNVSLCLFRQYSF